MVMTSKKSSSYRRILLGLSCCDFASSLLYPFQPFLVPQSTSQRVWAIGSDASCSATGFFQQFAFSNVWYNGMLSFYFLLTVKFGVPEATMAQKYELWMHIPSVGYPLVTALIGAGMGIYHELTVGPGCWIINYPEGCGCREGETGECCLSPLIAWIFAGIPAFLSFIAILVNNLLVYFHVRNTIQRGRRHSAAAAQRVSFSPPSQSNTDSQVKRIRAVATQAFLYVAGFLICYWPGLTLRIMESRNSDAEDENALFPLLIMQGICLPLQGFFNCLIYVRPTYQRVRIDFPNESRFWAFRRALHGDKVQPTDEEEPIESMTF